MIQVKNIVKITLLFVAIIFIFCSFSLEKTHDRTINYALSESLKAQITQETKNMTVQQIIEYSLDLTAQKLQFDTKNDIAHGKANCIGYAQLCSAICNQGLKSNGYTCRVKPVVGYIKNCGVNLCSILKSIAPNQRWKHFVQDHDFVELSYEDKVYYFDPSIYDVLGNKCLTIK